MPLNALSAAPTLFPTLLMVRRAAAMQAEGRDGRAFGAPGYLRLSFATEESPLIEGCRRLVATLGAGS